MRYCYPWFGEGNHCLGDVTQLHYKRLLMDAQNFSSRVKKTFSDRYWRRNGKDIGIGIATHIHLFRPCKRQRVGCIGHIFYLDFIWVDIKENAHERCIIILHNDINPFWKGKWQVERNLWLVASLIYCWILLNIFTAVVLLPIPSGDPNKAVIGALASAWVTSTSEHFSGLSG